MAPPSVYLLYGDDAFNIKRALASLRAKLGPSGVLNLLRLSGPSLDLAELRAACASLPFLTERRLVIVAEAESLPSHVEFQNDLKKLLSGLPQSTALVFVADLARDRSAAAEFQRRSAVFSWASTHPEQAYVKQFRSPRGGAFVNWLVDRAAHLGGQLDRSAAQSMAEYIDQDVSVGDTELRKLVAYAGEDRPISVQDVEALTPIYGQTDIFRALDAIGRGSGSFGDLQRLLEEQDPGYVFLMVARQFRLMLQARRAIDRGADPVEAMRVHSFVARKVAAQARNFSLPTLERFHQRLHQLDVQVKRGEADLALDLIPLVASLAA